MSENGEIYTAGKNFTLLPAVTALTNSTSVNGMSIVQYTATQIQALFFRASQMDLSHILPIMLEMKLSIGYKGFRVQQWLWYVHDLIYTAQK